MSIDRTDFDSLNEDDLLELVTSQVPEGLRVDYKRDMYGNADSDKREALKDVSAFANAFGGHLLIGVEEQNGLPVAVSGVSDVNPDDVVLRLDQLIRAGVEPRLQGIRVRAIALRNGASCFVIRIPKSWHPPHRVCAQNSNRFWIRNSGGSHEASVEELRSLFTLGADALDRVLSFRDARLREIRVDGSSRPLAAGSRLILHIVPLASVVARWAVDLQSVYNAHIKFRPLGAMGMSPRFNLDGFINERGGDANHGYTQVYRNGIIEAAKADIARELQSGQSIPGGAMESQVFEVLPGYINTLRDLGVPPPLIVLFSLDGVAGVSYVVRQNTWGEPLLNIERDTVLLPACYVDQYGSDIDYQRAVRPAFDALWNTAGYVNAQSFNQDGRWIGNQWSQ